MISPSSSIVLRHPAASICFWTRIRGDACSNSTLGLSALKEALRTCQVTSDFMSAPETWPAKLWLNQYGLNSPPETRTSNPKCGIQIVLRNKRTSVSLSSRSLSLA